MLLQNQRSSPTFGELTPLLASLTSKNSTYISRI
jgi:hypothetical protein